MTNSFTGRRFSRRQTLRGAGIGAAGLAGAALIGCGDDDEADSKQGTPAAVPTSGGSAATAAPQEQPKKGGTFRFSANISHLDPHTTTIAFATPVTSVMYSGLLRSTPWAKAPFYELDLAKSVEQPDNLTYVFKLNEGVKFHNKPPVNGRVLTAEDVKASLERVATKDPLFVHGADIDTIASIEAVDANTVRIKTKEPDSRLLGTIALPQYIVAAKESFTQFKDLRTVASAIGTGPYILDAGWNKDNGGRFTPNPAYFRSGLPYIESVEHVVISGNSFEQFLAGRVNQGAVPQTEVKGWEQKYAGYPNYLAGGLASATGRQLNVTRAPFNDARLRQALHLLTNRQESLAFSFEGFGRVSAGGLGWDHNAYNIAEQEILTWPGFRADKKADIAEGIKLLEGAGFTKANPLKFGINGWATQDNRFGTPAFERTKAEYEKASEGRIQVTIKGIDFATTKEVEARGEFDMDEAYWVVGPDPDHVLSKLHASNGGRNYARHKDPALDALLAKQRQAFKFEERKAAIAEVVKKINEAQPIIWMSTGYNVNLGSKNLRAMLPTPSGGNWQLERAWFA